MEKTCGRFPPYASLLLQGLVIEADGVRQVALLGDLDLLLALAGGLAGLLRQRVQQCGQLMPGE